MSGIKLIENESERNAQLLAAREQFLKAKAALDADYAQKERDLDQQNFETKMQVYSQIAGMTGQVFSDMTALLEQSVGKSNALYKTMFFASKAASIAQAIVNTEEGLQKHWHKVALMEVFWLELLGQQVTLQLVSWQLKQSKVWLITV
nr:hypothetical protein [Acinetobacter sp. FDAARGOS_558]